MLIINSLSGVDVVPSRVPAATCGAIKCLAPRSTILPNFIASSFPWSDMLIWEDIWNYFFFFFFMLKIHLIINGWWPTRIVPGVCSPAVMRLWGCLPGRCSSNECLRFFLFVLLTGAVIDASPPENILMPNETKPHVSMEMRGRIWIGSSCGPAQVADDDNNLYNHIQLPSSTSLKVNAS